MSWDEEMESHIAMRAEVNERAGMSPADARSAAERSFGNRGQISERVRAVTVPVWLDQFGQDIRYTVRGFRRSPGFVFTIVAALALGIGASTAVFSFVDRILFRPLPYRNERELVWFGMTAPFSSGNEFILDENYYTTWKAQQTAFAAMTVTTGVNDCSLSELNPVQLRCSQVDENYLSVFGYRPLSGRDFSEADAQVSAPQVSLISKALWTERFGGGDISNRTLEIDGVRTAVIGVLPQDFEMPSLARVDVLQILQSRGNRSKSGNLLLLSAFARLRPNVNLTEARTRMEPLFQEALQLLPQSLRKEVRFVVSPLRDRQVRDSERGALLLFAAVVLLLLIAVANAANLSLAHMEARRREFAVRSAIGAGQVRLARQIITESLALGVLGGASGLVVAAVLLHLFRALAPAGIVRLDQANVDWRIAGFSLVATITVSLLSGFALAMRTPVPEALTGGRIAGHRRNWLRPALVISQISLSLVLLCGAALLIESLRNLAKVHLGIETSSLFSAYAQLPTARYPQASHRTAFWGLLSEHLAAVPGVEAVGIASSLPPDGRRQGRVFSSIYVEGRPKQDVQLMGGMVTVREVSPSYFSMLRIPVRKGRLFGQREKEAIVLSEQMAARIFPNEAALGRRLILSGEGTREVVGIVGEVRNSGLTASSEPEIYILDNREQLQQYSLIRADTRVMPFVREVYRELDPRLTVQLETLDDRVQNLRMRPKFQSMLLSGFAASGLLLAAIGLYGVLALLTTQRAGEIGVRMALGATPGNIYFMVFRQAGWWTLTGVTLGLCGAAACANLIDGQLYQVNALAPLPLSIAVGTLALAAFVATWLPGRRASRVSPIQALREL